MTLKIRIIRDPDACRAVRGDWARLVALEGKGVYGFDATATFEWSETLWHAYLDGAPQWVIVAEDETGVRGILPCSISEESLGGVVFRRLATISSIYDLRNGFLVGGSADVLDLLIQHATHHISGWDAFVFKVIDSGLSDVALKEVVKRHNLRLLVLRHWLSPFISLPASPDQVMPGLKPNMRSNVRRGEKQLKCLGKLEYRFFDSEVKVPEFLNLMAVVEERSWKLAAGSAMTGKPKQEKLYRTLTPAMARHGWFLGGALLLDDRPLAFIYGFAFSGVFVDEKESYDDQYKEYRPGNVLKARFLEELVRRKVNTYDYAGEPDQHKARWTDQAYSRTVYIFCNRTARGRLLSISLSVRKWFKSLRTKSEREIIGS